MKLTLGWVADAVHAEGDFTTGVEVAGYSIDSRTVGAGELYFAVKGERLDGHDFVEAALGNGAAAAVVSMRWLAPAGVDACRLLRVPDHDGAGVLDALQRLARAVRRAWGVQTGGRVVGVTGSAGKTTTKEMVAAVLGARLRVLKSAGNLNNGFGVPLQLLRLEREHEVAVIEMGMNHAGEIRALAGVAEPDWAVVTNVAAVHLEHFPEGIGGIAAAKRELVEALPGGGVACLNADDVWVRGFADGLDVRAVLCGMDAAATVRAVQVAEVGAEGVVFTVEAGGERGSVQLRLLGRHNVQNALAAIAVGLESGISLGECCSALGELTAGDKRGEVVAWRGATLINDCYNSNPRALDAMVDALLAMPAERHVVIAGEMLELGVEAEALHAACGRRMVARGVDVVVGGEGNGGGPGGGCRRCLLRDAGGGRGLDAGACAGGGCGVAEGVAGGKVGAGAGGFGLRWNPCLRSETWVTRTRCRDGSILVHMANELARSEAKAVAKGGSDGLVKAAKKAAKHAAKKHAKKAAKHAGEKTAALKLERSAGGLRTAFHHMQRAAVVISLMEKGTGEDLRDLLARGVKLYERATEGKGDEATVLRAIGVLRAAEHLAMAGLYEARRKHREKVPAPEGPWLVGFLAETAGRLKGIEGRESGKGPFLHPVAEELVRQAEDADHDPHMAFELAMAADALCFALENGL